jgi:hypothetical protein
VAQRYLSAVYQELAGLDNVVGVGTGHKLVRGQNSGQEATIVLVSKKYKKNDLKRNALIPKSIDGKVTDVIEVGDVRLLGVDRKDRLRPAKPGVSLGHHKVSAGTFGAVVRDRSTGETLILSNNHVLANLSNGFDSRAMVGDAVLQPGLYDGGDLQTAVIGNLKRFIPLVTEEISPHCQIAKAFEWLINKCINIFQPHYRVQVLRDSERMNLVDCAVAVPASPDLIDPEIIDIGKIAGIKEPQMGMTVKKSGRSSGLTYSIVLATDVTIRVGISNTQYGVFSDQVLAGPMSLPGDSGSLVLTEDNHAVGLLFAGSEQVTMFNRIGRVLDALNVMF